MKVRINDREIPVAQSWNELPLRMQMFIYGVLMTDVGKVFETHELIHAKKMIIVQHLLGLSDQFMKDWAKDVKDVEGESAEEVFFAELDEVLRVADFLFERIPGEEDEPDKYQINLGLTRCPYPVVTFPKGNKKKYYYGPADGLENITIYEMGTLFTLFENFLKTQDEAIANELIATMYRPSKPSTRANKQSGYAGDRRLPLRDHEAMIKKRIPRMAKMPRNAKQIILFWLASCRHQIIKAFPNVFDSGSSSDPNDPWKNNTGNDYGWGGVLLSLADGLVNLDTISDKNHYDALTYLSYLEDQRKLAARRAARAKR